MAEKKLRRVVNARAKREMQDAHIQQEKFSNVVDKIAKIREVSYLKEKQLQERR
jgi:hypothetical protein